MSNASSEIYTFGPYTLDPASRSLTRSGTAVNIAPKAFDLLVLMVESGGCLLSKRELMDSLWSGTFVEESNLSFQISTLRKLLGEEGSAWIEAVPKHGYRFRAPIEKWAATQRGRPEAKQLQSAEQEVDRGASHARRIWLIAAIAGVLAIIAGFATWIRWPENRRQRGDAVLDAVPATTYPGRETHPTFSPDGSQLAFAWGGESGNNLNIYVKVVGESRALRLTNDPRPEFSPVWSPDGRHIAFCRDGQLGTEVVVIPALGGPERVVANLPQQGDPKHPGTPGEWMTEGKLLAWFPDGRFLAMVGGRGYQFAANAIFRLGLDTGEIQRLTSPPGRGWGDGNPAISPDGRWLAFTRSETGMAVPATLCVLPLSDEKGPGG